MSGRRRSRSAWGVVRREPTHAASAPLIYGGQELCLGGVASSLGEGDGGAEVAIQSHLLSLRDCTIRRGTGRPRPGRPAAEIVPAGSPNSLLATRGRLAQRARLKRAVCRL